MCSRVDSGVVIFNRFPEQSSKRKEEKKRGGQKTGMERLVLSICPAWNEKHLLCEAVDNILALLFLSLGGRRDVGNEA